MSPNQEMCGITLSNDKIWSLQKVTFSKGLVSKLKKHPSSCFNSSSNSAIGTEEEETWIFQKTSKNSYF